MGSIAVPYLVKDDDGSKHVKRAKWEKRMTMPRSALSAKGLSEAPEISGEENQDITVKVSGEWAFLPIITGQVKKKGPHGKKFSVFTGFTVPLISEASDLEFLSAISEPKSEL